MGWTQTLITVIDEDLGLSGAGTVKRSGFERLVASISLGQIGIILVTEISRLSRLNSDWHRVIELCAVFKTLIADEDGLYDPCDPNDRLVLGLKGTLFSAELHIIQARMRGGLLNKAKRGELSLRLPIGYRRLSDGKAVLEPDDQVRKTIELIFDQFTRLNNARAVQRYFIQHQIKMPRLIQKGPDAGSIRWVSPAYQMVQHVLLSPVYAGVFVFGRRKLTMTLGDPPIRKNHRVPLDEWDIMLRDIYPAYISYDQYLSNRRIMSENLYNFNRNRCGDPREGNALLQGLIICGRCGRRMIVDHGSDQYKRYVCRRATDYYAAPLCQGFAVKYLDQSLTEIFFEAIKPARLESILAALDAIEKQRQDLDQNWQLRLERARYQVDRARRQYDVIEPENRLVARELEKRWNDEMKALEQLEQEYARARSSELAPLNEEEQQAVRCLGENLPAIWNAPTTTTVDRKRLLRIVITEVSLTVDSGTRSAECVILWNGGAATKHRVEMPPIGWHCVTEPEVVERIRQLAPTTPDHQIAAQLNADGVRTKSGKEWSFRRVASLRKTYQIPTGCPLNTRHTHTRGDGLVSTTVAAKMLKITPSLVQYWITHGVLVCDQRVTGSRLWVRVTTEDLKRLDGSFDSGESPTIKQVMKSTGLTRDEIWKRVREGQYIAYRAARGQSWEWRLRETEKNHR